MSRRAQSALSLAIVPMIALAGCGEDEAPGPLEAGEPRALEIVLQEVPTEGGPPSGPFDRPAPSLRDVFEHVEAVATRDRGKGLLLRVSPMGGAWGRAADLLEAVVQVREAERPIHCHFEEADNLSYAFMARACDRIAMTPAGRLSLVGVAAQLLYAAPLLERLGVRPQIVAMGRYKSAGDILTEAEMPDSTREALGAILEDLSAELEEAVASRIDGDRAAARALLDSGPISAQRARETGLVDDLEFDDETRQHLREAAGVSEVERAELLPPRKPLSLLRLIEALSDQGTEEEDVGPHVALVLVEGAIVDGSEPVPGRSVSGPFVEHLRELADDDAVQAIVLRISSPGGSALASDRMWHAVRRAEARKPVIVSIGDMAASGGYYIASAGSEILAQPNSLVGSIGVIGGKVDLSGLATAWGVNPAVLERSERAAWGSPLIPFTDQELAHLRSLIRATYERFIRRVMQSRDMSREAVLAAAEGRVMTGQDGLDAGLLDRIAGLDAALARAREAGDLAEDAPIRAWPERKTFLEMIGRSMSGRRSARHAAEVVHGLPLPPAVEHALVLSELLDGDGSGVAALPYTVEIR